MPRDIDFSSPKAIHICCFSIVYLGYIPYSRWDYTHLCLSKITALNSISIMHTYHSVLLQLLKDFSSYQIKEDTWVNLVILWPIRAAISIRRQVYNFKETLEKHYEKVGTSLKAFHHYKA